MEEGYLPDGVVFLYAAIIIERVPTPVLGHLFPDNHGFYYWIFDWSHTYLETSGLELEAKLEFSFQ